MKQQLSSLVIMTLLFGGVFASEGVGLTLFNETYTGAELATFPILTTRPTSVSGNTLNVGTGGIFSERLLEIPIVTAGAIAPNQEVSISFSLTESPPPGASGDHDIYVGVDDGMFFTGFGRQDNGGWRGFVINGDENGSFGIQQTLFSGAGFAPTFDGVVTTDGINTTVSGSFNGHQGEDGSVVTLDPSQELKLFILLDHTFESYAISSLNVTVTLDTDDDVIPISITPPGELTLNGLDINEGFFTIEEIMVFDIDLNATNIDAPDPILAQIGSTDPHFLFNAPDGTKVINIVGFFDPENPDLDPANFNYTIGSIKDDVSNLGFTAFLPSDTNDFAFQWTDLGATDSLGDNTDLFSSTNPKDSLNLISGNLSFDNGMDPVIFASPDLIGDGSAGAAGQIEHGTIRGGNDPGPGPGAGPGPGPGPGNGAVPEPITAALGLMGLGVLGMTTRRRVA